MGKRVQYLHACATRHSFRTWAAAAHVVDIYVSRPREDADGGEHFEGALVEAGRDDVPPSEVPSTLARLLGEVGK